MTWKKELKGFLFARRNEEMVILEQLMLYPLRNEVKKEAVQNLMGELGMRPETLQPGKTAYIFTARARANLAKEFGEKGK